MEIKSDPDVPKAEIVAALKSVNERLSVVVGLKAINESLLKIVDLLTTHIQASQTRNKILDEKLEEIAQEVAILNSTMEMKQGD